MPVVRRYLGNESAPKYIPNVDLSDNPQFMIACHRQWELEGKGIVTFEFREKMLNRDLEMEAKLHDWDKVITWARDEGLKG